MSIKKVAHSLSLTLALSWSQRKEASQQLEVAIKDAIEAFGGLKDSVNETVATLNNSFTDVSAALDRIDDKMRFQSFLESTKGFKKENRKCKGMKKKK